MRFQDFKTIDGVPLVDLAEGRCFLIADGGHVTERRVHHIDVWQKKYAICDVNGNAYCSGQNPETCLYADPAKAWLQIVANANATHAATVLKATEGLVALRQKSATPA